MTSPFFTTEPRFTRRSTITPDARGRRSRACRLRCGPTARCGGRAARPRRRDRDLEARRRRGFARGRRGLLRARPSVPEAIQPAEPRTMRTATMRLAFMATAHGQTRVRPDRPGGAGNDQEKTRDSRSASKLGATARRTNRPLARIGQDQRRRSRIDGGDDIAVRLARSNTAVRRSTTSASNSAVMRAKCGIAGRLGPDLEAQHGPLARLFLEMLAAKPGEVGGNRRPRRAGEVLRQPRPGRVRRGRRRWRPWTGSSGRGCRGSWRLRPPRPAWSCGGSRRARSSAPPHRGCGRGDRRAFGSRAGWKACGPVEMRMNVHSHVAEERSAVKRGGPFVRRSRSGERGREALLGLAPL